MVKHFVCFVSLCGALALCACSEHGSSPTAPSRSGGSDTIDFDSFAAQMVGLTSSGEGYVRWWGNMNYLTNFGDWNGAQLNLFVTSRGRVTKYIVEAYNSVATIEGQQTKSTIIRSIDFGDAVRFELRVILPGGSNYNQVIYDRYRTSQFELIPGSMSIDGNHFTVGPLPARDTSLSTGLSAGGRSMSFSPIDREPMPLSIECVANCG